MDFSAEFLAIPHQVTQLDARVSRLLGNGASKIVCGNYAIWIGGASGAHAYLHRDERGLRIASDHVGVLPVYRVATPKGAVWFSSSATLLAVLLGRKLRIEALLDDLQYGFRPGNQTIFQGIERLAPYEQILLLDDTCISAADPDHVVISAEIMPVAPTDDLSGLASRVGQCFADGYALELTGGVDSRLVLALGLSKGFKPAVAFTIGDEDSADVEVARKIASELGFEHLRLEYPSGCPRGLYQDILEFVSQGDFYPSAASYARLPSVFRQLAPLRSCQVGGVGGEMGTGFYYTPMDNLICNGLMRWVWYRLRFSVPGNVAARVFSPDFYHSAQHASYSRVMEVLLSMPARNWRERVDALYREHRMRQWAGPVLKASSHWYGIYMPFLDRAYVRWGASVPAESKGGRKAQLELIASLAPALASLPYEKDIIAARSGRGKHGGKLEVIRKIIHRLLSRRKAADLGAGQTAAAMLADEYVRADVADFLQEYNKYFDMEHMDALLSSPEMHAQEVGFIVTAAMAHKVLKYFERSGD